MNSLNSIILEGRVRTIVSSTRTAAGTFILSFIVETKRNYRSSDGIEKEIEYFPVRIYGSLAETSERKMSKGQMVRVVGRISQRMIRAEGKALAAIIVVGEHVDFKPRIGDES